MSIRMRRGLEADFDASKMVTGEWAVSTDTRYVRMCFAPGVVLRMATYDAFEADMQKIQDILATCQTIEQVVQRIGAEVNSNAKIVVENTAKAKEYMEQAKTYAESASAVTGVEIATQDTAGLVKGGENHIAEDGTLTLTKKTSESTLYNSHAGGIKLIGLHGKSEQKQYSGKNKVDLSAWEFNDSEYAHQYLISSDVTAKALYDFLTENVGKQIVLSLKTTGADYGAPIGSIYAYDSSSALVTTIIPNTAYTIPELPENVSSFVVYGSPNGASATDFQVEFGEVATDIEPYVGGIPASNPDYPQEIKSVVVSEIKTHGKNLLKNTATTGNVSGLTFTVNDDKSVTVSGTTTGANNFVLRNMSLTAGEYKLSGMDDVVGSGDIKISVYDQVNKKVLAIVYPGLDAYTFTLAEDTDVMVYVNFNTVGVTYSGTIYPMIRKADIDDATYEPYTESVVTLSEPITLNGIGESIDILTPENVKRRFYTERVTTSMLALEEVNYNDTNTKGFTIIPSKKCASGDADNIKCTIARYGSGTDKNTCRIKNSESIAIFLDMGEFPSLSDFSNYLASNEVYITYELAEEITEVLPTADQIALRGLKSFDTVTYITTDSEVEPFIDAEYGTSKVGALALENAELHAVNEILLGGKAEQSEVDAITTDIVALNESLGDIRYIILDQTLGNESINKPWLELEAQISNLEIGKTYVGRIQAGSKYAFYGCRVTDAYASFMIQTYYSNSFYHVYMNGGVWYHEQLALNSNLTDYMVAVDVEFDFTEVDTFQTVSKDITSLIPVGYKVIDAHGVRGGGDYVFISDISLRDNTLSLALYNPSGTIESGYPAAKIICVRDI